MAWDANQALTEADLALAAKSETLKSIRIIKDEVSFYLLIQLTWRKEESLFLATTRSKKAPRQFKDMGRLIEFIEETCPNLQTLTLELKPTIG